MKLNRRQAKQRATYERLAAFLTQDIHIEAIGRADVMASRLQADVLTEVFIIEARRQLAFWSLSTLGFSPATLIEVVFDVNAAHAELKAIEAEIGDPSIDPTGDLCGARRFLTAASSGWKKFNVRIVDDGLPDERRGRP